MKLSILICSLESRVPQLHTLLDEIDRQIGDRRNDVERLVLRDNGHQKTGYKRNALLDLAVGDYVCFIDDDDKISPNYVNILLEAIKTNTDCVSLKGVMTTSGNNPEVFEHSIKYKAYRTTDNPIKYERYPNHLNCIRASIAKQFKFPEINHGEDYLWAKKIFESGLIKTEFYTDEILYYYRYEPIK